jgi:hypothetical protein
MKIQRRRRIAAFGGNRAQACALKPLRLENPPRRVKDQVALEMRNRLFPFCCGRKGHGGVMAVAWTLVEI